MAQCTKKKVRTGVLAEIEINCEHSLVHTLTLVLFFDIIPLYKSIFDTMPNNESERMLFLYGILQETVWKTHR